MPGRHVREAHRGIGLVDVLTAGAGGAIGVGAHILVEDLDVDRVVDLRIDPHARERGVPARVRIIRADAHQTMHARFRLQPAVRVLAMHEHRRGLDAGRVAALLFQQIGLEAARIRPTQIHAHQHLGPILALGAACAGIELDVGVVAHPLRPRAALQVRPSPRAPAPPSGCRCASSIERFVAFGFRHLSEFDASHAARARARECCSSPLSSLLRSRISFWAFSGSFQKSGRSESAVSSSNRTWARSQSKTPPQQSDGGFDLFSQSGDFGAHDLKSFRI